jgi:hypothetical protein
MLRVGVYVPISLNEKFVNMIYFLVRSFDRFSGLNDYRFVFTVSLDSAIDSNSSLLNWTKKFPIEFRHCDEKAWAVHAKRALDEKKPWFQYAATAKQQMAYDFDEDVVIFIDADTVVCGSLVEVVARAVQETKILARTAWQPPSIDLVRALRERGCAERNYGLEYAGYGWSFMEPRACPPYFNFGFVVMPGDLARLMRDNLSADGAFVEERFYDVFGLQTALCLLICRLSLGYGGLDEKYNFGNGDTIIKYPIHPDPVAARALYERSVASIKDMRVIHYTVQLPQFSKDVDMRSWDNVLNFCAQDELGIVNTRLRDTFRLFVGDRF